MVPRAGFEKGWGEARAGRRGSPPTPTGRSVARSVGWVMDRRGGVETKPRPRFVDLRRRTLVLTLGLSKPAKTAKTGVCAGGLAVSSCFLRWSRKSGRTSAEYLDTETVECDPYPKGYTWVRIGYRLTC